MEALVIVAMMQTVSMAEARFGDNPYDQIYKLDVNPLLAQVRPSTARNLCARGNPDACTIVEIDCGNGIVASCELLSK